MVTYVVKPFDTIEMISYYFGFPVYLLMQLNNIYYPWDLYPGRVVFIPLNYYGMADNGYFAKNNHLSNINVINDIPDKNISQLNDEPKNIDEKSDYIIYEIKEDDTIYQIAKKYNTTMSSIIKLNNINDLETITLGQKIKVPKMPQNSVIYTVKPDDTLQKIAEKLKIPADYIRRINFISENDSLYPGQQLVIINDDRIKLQ